MRDMWLEFGFNGHFVASEKMTVETKLKPHVSNNKEGSISWLTGIVAHRLPTIYWKQRQ
jgi:hypothetical protein